jgi:hypothetical protein
VVISLLIHGRSFVLMYSVQVHKEMIQLCWSVGPDFESVIHILEAVEWHICVVAEYDPRVLCEAVVNDVRKRGTMAFLIGLF